MIKICAECAEGTYTYIYDAAAVAQMRWYGIICYIALYVYAVNKKEDDKHWKKVIKKSQQIVVTVWS